MPTIDVDNDTKRSVAFAARMAGVSEGEIVRRLILATAPAERSVPVSGETGVAIFAVYEGRRTRAIYYPPGRVEIIDGPLQGESFKSPTGAARAVVRHYNPAVDDNRNGWSFWQIDNGGGARVWLQSIRATGSRDPEPNAASAATTVLRSFKNNGLRVVFVLLCVPELVASPYREIAESSGTSLGTVQGVLAELHEIGFVSIAGDVRRLHRTRDLFKQWVSAYALDLRPRLRIAAFDAPDPDWWRHSTTEVQANGGQWGGEVAAHILGSQLLPARATIYASEIPSKLAIQRRFRRATSDGNVEIRQHFWSFPPQRDMPTVPTPLIYADLIASGDSREIEAAEYLRENDEILRRLS